jgi:two-component system, NtrC family, sensor kinase
MEAIGQLTGGVAHDFNNLLAVIIGNATMIRRRSAGDSKLVDNILVASERGVALTRQLLSLSRHKAQTRQVVDLRLEMPRIIEMLRPSLRGDIELRFAIASKLPHIDIDLGEFEIALLNLAVNARDAMPAGGEFVVDVTNQQQHDTSKLLEDRACVVISIQDTGVGMPKEVLERASEPFFTTKKLGSGTGLGLSQVRSFVEASEGRLTIDSAVESGTTVTLYLPETDKARQSPQVGDTVDHKTCLSGCVLLVDDNRDVANTTAAMLDAMGLEVEIADRAIAALEQLSIAPNRFKLLITDVVMPGMNGIDLAREVRVRLPHLPIILMSGYSDTTGTSGDEFKLLRKPVSFELLYVAIRESSS